MIVVALAGPWLTLGCLIVLHQLERWLDASLWGSGAAGGISRRG